MRRNNLPIVLGGSKDCYYGPVMAGIQNYGKISLISITPMSDVRPLHDESKISVNSTLRKLIEECLPNNTIKKVCLFGVQQQLLSEDDLVFLNKHEKIIIMQNLREIRTTKL